MFSALSFVGSEIELLPRFVCLANQDSLLQIIQVSSAELVQADPLNDFLEARELFFEGCEGDFRMLLQDGATVVPVNDDVLPGPNDDRIMDNSILDDIVFEKIVLFRGQRRDKRTKLRIDDEITELHQNAPPAISTANVALSMHFFLAKPSRLLMVGYVHPV